MVRNIKIAFLDDNKNSLDLISGSVSQILRNKGFIAEIYSFYSSELFLKKDRYYDIFFCDIEMPDMDGIKVSKIYHKKYAQSKIIFVSNREDRVFDSLEVHPFGFVRKKNFINDIEKVIDCYTESLDKETNERENAVFQSNGTIVSLPLNDIVYIESDKRNQNIYLISSSEPIIISSNMKTIVSELEQKGFVQTHKSFLVNMDFIKEINSDSVLLKTGQSVFLSRRKASEVKEKFMKKMQDKESLIFI